MVAIVYTCTLLLQLEDRQKLLRILLLLLLLFVFHAHNAEFVPTVHMDGLLRANIARFKELVGGRGVGVLEFIFSTFLVRAVF